MSEDLSLTISKRAGTIENHHPELSQHASDLRLWSNSVFKMESKLEVIQDIIGDTDEDETLTLLRIARVLLTD